MCSVVSQSAELVGVPNADMLRDSVTFGPTDPRITCMPAREAQPRYYKLRSSSVPDVSPRESTSVGASGISRGPGVPTRPDQVSSAPALLFPDSPPTPVMSPPVPATETTTQPKPPTLLLFSIIGNASILSCI